MATAREEMTSGAQIGKRIMYRLLWAIGVLLIFASPGLAADPLNTVRTFCRADGNGDRLHPRTWPSVASLVAWRLEPAWDRVRLIRGYEVKTPRRTEYGVAIEVTYTVGADVRSGTVHKGERLETRTYRLRQDGPGAAWRIRGPAPVPYVFASQVDAEAMAALLEPTNSAYVSASALVWRLLRDAGRDLPYADTEALASAPGFVPVETAQPGDVVLYYDGSEPYHAGLVEAGLVEAGLVEAGLGESRDQVVSATLNAGVQRAPFAAFAGEVRYRRPVAAKMTPSIPADDDETPMAAATPDSSPSPSES